MSPHRFAFLLLGFASLIANLNASTDPLLEDIQQAWAVAAARAVETQAALPNLTTWPTIGNGATWNTTQKNTDWRAGFWPGILWMLANRIGDPDIQSLAQSWTLSVRNTASSDHDVGFIRLSSAGKALRSLNDLNDPDGLTRADATAALLEGAAVLNSLFNHDGVPVGMTRSWFGIEDPYPVCIDNLMNIELLMVAWQLGGEAAFYDNALTHARTSIAQHMRSDGGTYHVVRHFESGPDAGEVERKSTRQGFGDETTWSRGQAWAIYGLTAAYAHALRGQDPDPSDIRAAAEAAAEYFLARLPSVYSDDPYNFKAGDFVPPSDFQAALGEPVGPWNNADNDETPGEINSGTLKDGRSYLNDRILAVPQFTRRDSSAAAVAAAGLLQLNKYASTPAKAAAYLQAAKDILHCLITFDGEDAGDDPDYINTGPADPGILRNGSQWYGDTNRSLIYGDYYFLEAICRYEAIAARLLLDESLRLIHQPGNIRLTFDRHEPALALQWTLQQAGSPQGPWTDLAHRTGASDWEGTLVPTEAPPAGGIVTVLFNTADDGVPRFYRVLTRSVAEW